MVSEEREELAEKVRALRKERERAREEEMIAECANFMREQGKDEKEIEKMEKMSRKYFEEQRMREKEMAIKKAEEEELRWKRSRQLERDCCTKKFDVEEFLYFLGDSMRLSDETIFIATEAATRVMVEHPKASPKTIVASIIYQAADQLGEHRAGHWLALKADVSETTLRKNPYIDAIKEALAETINEQPDAREKVLEAYRQNVQDSINKALKKGNLTYEEAAEELEHFAEFCKLDSKEQFSLAYLK